MPEEDEAASQDPDQAATSEEYEDALRERLKSVQAALRERLKRVQSELEVQGASAIAVAHDVEVTRKEAEANNRKLTKLRAKWSAEQPEREALLQETGEKERRLAERERQCAELLAAQAQAEVEKAFYRGAGSQEGSASCSDAIAEDAGASTVPKTPSAASQRAKQLGEHREHLASLEKSRRQLMQTLTDLRDAARQESAGAGQLQQRCEALRRESHSLKAATLAARESEASARRKLEALDQTTYALQQRQQGMERTVAELKTEVQTLRSELSTSTAASSQAAAASATGGAPAPPSVAAAGTAGEESEAATWATNRLLQAKVLALQEELQRRHDRIHELRLRARGSDCSTPSSTAAAAIAAQ